MYCAFTQQQQQRQFSVSLPVPPPPKLAKAKRKVDSENGSFQDRWEAEYMFTDVKGKAVCLVCGSEGAALKEYNIRRHYEARHQEPDPKH